MNEILQSLGNLGLTEKESKIYVALLRLGEATVGDIADEATIKRPTAYVILDELRKKGMVLKIPHAKKTIFQVKSPDELHKQAIDNISQFEKMLPKMRAINPQQKELKTLYFEGLQGIKEALHYKIDELHGETLTGFWAKNDGIQDKVMGLFDAWGKQSLKRNISFTGITPDHPSIRALKEKNPAEYKNVLLVPELDYSSDISIDINKEFLRIVDPHDLKALIIENPRIVEAMRQIFAIVKEKYQKSDGSVQLVNI